MAKIHAYLNFDGNCEEAFRFYEKVFHTQNLGTHRYCDMPGGDGAPEIPDEIKDRVLHTAIRINESTMLMGSDIVEGMVGLPVHEGNQTYIMLDTESAGEAESLYKALADGAKNIEMKLEPTFFAELYASFQDRFGIWWMIHYEGNVKMG
ncbi:VOC family protein [Sinomicrobium soli]|uniref:VOC family protein n=1 Tax=Sinomicrobium sp. N-1-3-6 TaxID=2219864 RepID=UPI000DCBE8AE|nr:VOC family protein [Sinomicrobium sp. N-1-3-6]RAV29069.1 VOC family protein [Sinomicrobium sp. N-1-3-6]